MPTCVHVCSMHTFTHPCAEGFALKCSSICIYSQSTVDILVTITSSGDNTAGDGYSLMCSTRISTGLIGQPTITWLDSMDNEIIISTNGILTFNPLMVSDAGMYTCRAILNSIVETAEVMVTVESEYLVTACILCGLCQPLTFQTHR